MALLYKNDFERAQQYWDALWQHEIFDRPCTNVRAPSTKDAPPLPRLCGIDEDINAFVQRFDNAMQQRVYLGEAMPSFRPGFGPDQMAGFLGAEIVMSEDGATSWSEKCVRDWNDFLPLEITENNHCWQRMKELHAVAANVFTDRCLLAEIDMHSNVDMLEALRGAQNLLFDMIDSPEVIDKAMQQACTVYRHVHDTLYQYGEKAKWGTTSWLNLYDRGKFNVIQADFIALLNPEMFRRFVLPAIEDEAQQLDRCCFHLDGPDALNHLDDILAIDAIDAIQWVPGEGNGKQIEWPALLHKIQDAGKIILLHVSPEDVRNVHGEYRPEQLVYDVQAATPEEGQALLDWLVRNT